MFADVFRSKRNYNIREDEGLGPFPNSFSQTELMMHLQRRPGLNFAVAANY